MFFVHQHAAAAKEAGNQQTTGEAGPSAGGMVQLSQLRGAR